MRWSHRNSVVILVLLGTLAYALAEDLTLTTYYPSPRGVYQSLRTTDLRATETVAIGGQRPTDTSAQLIPHRLVVAGAPATNPTEVGGAPGPCPVGTAWYDDDANGVLDAQECKPPGLLVTTAGQVGIGTTSPAAPFEVASTTGGFLPPRMTTAQRDAIPAPVEGMVTYNTTTHQLNVYNGTAWNPVGGAHGQAVFDVPGTYTFIPPTSPVTVEVWGGGGKGGLANCPSGGSCCIGSCGGGGGGYGRQVIPVTPGVAYDAVVGAGGLYNTGADNPSGSPSYIRRSGSSAQLVSAAGGNAGWGYSTAIVSCKGGQSQADFNVSGENGKPGGPQGGDCTQPTIGGDGGAGGNGGAGGQECSFLSGSGPLVPAIAGTAPGGGGGGHCQSAYGADGAPGRVMISW